MQSCAFLHALPKITAVASIFTLLIQLSQKHLINYIAIALYLTLYVIYLEKRLWRNNINEQQWHFLAAAVSWSRFNAVTPFSKTSINI